MKEAVTFAINDVSLCAIANEILECLQKARLSLNYKSH